MSEVCLKNLIIKRDDFSICSDGVFKEGVHIVTGRVGCGKTTLSMALAGLIKPDSGEIYCSGVEKILLLMQFPEHHLTKLKVDDEIRSWGLEPDVVLEVSGLFGMGRKDPMKLSRGELKRLLLSCIFLKDSDLLILDEPFSTLDPVWKEKFCRDEFFKKKITIIFTHEQSFLPKADFIWEIEDGRLLFRGEVPKCLPLWKGAPDYIKKTLQIGLLPKNIRFEDVREALCRMHD